MRNDASLGTHRPWLFSVVSKILKTPALDYPTLLLNKCPTAVTVAFSRRVGASVFAKKQFATWRPKKNRGPAIFCKGFSGEKSSQIRQIFLGKKLLRSPYLDDYIGPFASCQYSTFFFWPVARFWLSPLVEYRQFNYLMKLGKKRHPWNLANLLVTVTCYFCQFCIIAKVAMINRQI